MFKNMTYQEANDKFNSYNFDQDEVVANRIRIYFQRQHDTEIGAMIIHCKFNLEHLN